MRLLGVISQAQKEHKKNKKNKKHKKHKKHKDAYKQTKIKKAAFLCA